MTPRTHATNQQDRPGPTATQIYVEGQLKERLIKQTLKVIFDNRCDGDILMHVAEDCWEDMLAAAQADAEQAYVQANLTGPATWICIPEEGWPDEWFYADGSATYSKPVCRLNLALYL